MEEIYRYVSLPNSEYKLQPVKANVIFLIILLGLLIIEGGVSLSPNFLGPNSAPLEMEMSYTMAS